MAARFRRPLFVALAVLAALLVIRALLPYAVRHYLNARMDRMGDYHGHIDDIDIHLWRGAYSIDDLRIAKVSGKLPVPLLQAPHTEIALSWRALSHGVLRGKIDFRQPVVNFVDGRGEGDSQSGKGVDWRAKLRLLTPIRLDELTVHGGTVTFRSFVATPRVDLKMTEVEATASNLTNIDRRGGSRVARLRASARLLGDARLQTQASFDPLSHFGDFAYQLQVTGVDLTRANDLARAYAGLDFAGGHGDFTMELQARDGALEGYAKPLFKDLQIFSWQQDVQQQHKNPIKLAWEALAQGVTSLFKNHAKDQFATRVPIRGRIDDRELGAVQAILGVLRNAFVQAYTPKLEHLTPAPGDAASDAGTGG
ncbi:DUF748 domain-containing protein [Dyella sp.]|jgi:hypothetical protein|uniref:DUF748 domain-containing protein n=1 Tax=Dyella sp. TaxID=1869338 RepID=UPI002D78AA74|nr:DUF748 domain-containing protein [Dyella sp.]HET6430630.1 DUF748 domain-containing protein [Dyella sp.]